MTKNNVGQTRWVSILLVAIFPLLGDAADRSSPPPQAETGPKPGPVLPPAPEELEQTIRQGVDFLLKRQNSNGSWGSVNITRPGEVWRRCLAPTTRFARR